MLPWLHKTERTEGKIFISRLFNVHELFSFLSTWLWSQKKSGEQHKTRARFISYHFFSGAISRWNWFIANIERLFFWPHLYCHKCIQLCFILFLLCNIAIILSTFAQIVRKLSRICVFNHENGQKKSILCDSTGLYYAGLYRNTKALSNEKLSDFVSKSKLISYFIAIEFIDELAFKE